MPTTKVLKVSSEELNSRSIKEAADVLQGGGLVAFPTETVYGLGADAFNETAIKKVFEAKQRPNDNPLIVHIANFEQLMHTAPFLPAPAKLLVETFWPGPLTLVVERSSSVPDVVTANLNTVAVRMPKHPVTLALIEEFGRGIVGPSANVSGTPSPTKAEHVYADLGGKIDMILDAGPTEIGVESTILDVTVNPPVVLRRGGLPIEKIEEIIGPVDTTAGRNFLNRSPGTRHRHYTPKATVVIVNENDLRNYKQVISRYGHKRIGCIVHSKLLREFETQHCSVVFVDSVQELSKKLYDSFRRFDQEGVDVILVEAISEQGVGGAIMDRVKRAASGSTMTKSWPEVMKQYIS